MSKLRILIVDDSLLARQMLQEMIESDPELEVIGTAGNGKEGVEKTRTLKPDLVTMDLMMPVMRGQHAIEHIMSSCPCPILVISSNNDSKVAFDACSRGALDVFPKDNLDPEKFDNLTRKIKLLAKIKVIGHIRPGVKKPTERPRRPADQKVIAIACSTGGPKALSQMLPHLPERYPHPIVIAQHIEDGYTSGLVEWLDQVCRLDLKLAEAGMVLSPNTVYISPSEKNIAIRTGGVISFEQRQEDDRYSPNCDVLLCSVARAFGPLSVGVILTGMATDGVKGMQCIREHGGMTVAQDEATGVVFGMNRQAIETGCVEKVMAIDDIGIHLATL